MNALRKVKQKAPGEQDFSDLKGDCHIVLQASHPKMLQPGQ